MIFFVKSAVLLNGVQVYPSPFPFFLLTCLNSRGKNPGLGIRRWCACARRRTRRKYLEIKDLTSANLAVDLIQLHRVMSSCDSYSSEYIQPCQSDVMCCNWEKTILRPECIAATPIHVSNAGSGNQKRPRKRARKNISTSWPKIRLNQANWIDSHKSN